MNAQVNTVELTSFQQAYQNRFGIVWTRFKKDGLSLHPWDGCESGQVSYAFNALADNKAFPVMLLDVPDQIKAASQVQAIKLDTGATIKVFVGQLLKAEDCVDSMQFEGDIAGVKLTHDADEILEIIHLTEVSRTPTGEKKEKAEKKPKAEKKAKVEVVVEPKMEAPAAEPEDPFASTEVPTEAASASDPTDPFAGVQGETDAEPPVHLTPEAEGAAAAEAVVTANTIPAPAPEPVKEKAKRKTKAEPEPEKEEVPTKLMGHGAYMAMKETVPDLLDEAMRLIKHARVAGPNDDPFALLRQAMSKLDRSGNLLVQLVARGALNAEPEIDPTIAVPAKSIIYDTRCAVRDLESGIEKPKNWAAFQKALKAIVKRAEGPAMLLKEEGVSELVAPAPKLRTQDGKSIENV